MALLTDVSMKRVYDHYLQRRDIHLMLLEQFEQQRIGEFAKLAVGLSDPRANYSASEYGGGVLILRGSSPQAVYDLASDLYACSSPHDIPTIIR
jgi:hypothetical protein